MSTGIATEASPAGGPAQPLVGVRKFPYPYRAMLAVCSDIDRTTITRFRNIHRFLNTREQTPIGKGVGLDVADSLWVFKRKRNRADISLLRDHDSHEPENYADELAHYARAGWIDTLHTYGNFTASPGTIFFERRHASMALDELRRRDIFLPVWVDHGSRTNVQNFGFGGHQVGDIPGSTAYHTDLLIEYGVRFSWNHLNGTPCGLQEALSPLHLRDGRRLWGFARYMSAVDDRAVEAFERHPRFYEVNPAFARNWGKGRPATMLWWPALLDSQLSTAVLNELTHHGLFSITAQHLGDLASEQELSPAAVEVFRDLRARQDAGDILVARTSRLLEYSRVVRHLRFEVRGGAEQLYVDITAIMDPVLGTFVPRLEQLRGITFQVPDPTKTHVLLNGRPIPGRELLRTAPDAAERAIGIRWFAADTTDYTVLADVVRDEPVRPVSSRHRSVVSWASEVLLADPPPEADGIEPRAYASATAYAARKFSSGTDYYERMVKRIGFQGAEHVLDVGSGGGHWSIALATVNQEVVGIEPNRSFIRVARRMAAHYGVEDRVRFVEGRAEHLVFPAASFDLVFCHSVLMYADHEITLDSIARWIAPGGLFYCGYTTSGLRVRDVISGLIEGNRSRVEGGLAVLLARASARAGLGGRRSETALSQEELLKMCAAVGLEFVTAPSVQDGPRLFCGLPCTFDFVCRRCDTGALAELGRMDLAPGHPGRRAYIRELIEAGLPALALEHCEHPDPGDPEAAELYLRGRLARGEAIETEVTLVDALPEPTQSLLMGMSSHLGGSHEAALRAFETAGPRSGSIEVLQALSLLELRRYGEAYAAVMEQPALTDRLTLFAIRTAALLGAYGPNAARQPAVELLSQLRDEAIQPSDVQQLIDQLS